MPLPEGFEIESQPQQEKPVGLPAGFEVEQVPDQTSAPQQTQPQSQDYGAANPLLEFAAAVNRGAVGIPDIPADLFNWIAEKAGSDVRAARFGDIDVVQQGTQGGYMEPGLARDVVRSAGEVTAGGVTGGAALRGAASQLPKMGQAAESTGRGVLRQLGSTTAGQDARMAAAAGAGMELGGEAGEAVGGETGRQVGELAGSVAAPAALAGTAIGTGEAIKKIFRGGATKQSMRSTIDDFAETGTSPTIAEATDRPVLKASENLSAPFWGGGRITRAREQAEQNIQSRLREIANDVSTNAGVDRAGRTIQRGVTAPGGFVDRFQAKSADLWSRVDEQIGREAAVELSSTKSTLGRLVRDDEFGQVLNNPQLTRIQQVLENADIADYQTLKELRSSIGRKISNNELVSDIPRAELKQLYGAITDDIRAAADQVGPRASAAFKRANNFTRSGHKRLDDFVERIANKVDLDKVFTAATKGGEGVGTINAMKRSLTKDEWNTVVSNVVRQMGKATAGQQDAAGEAFSVNKFLTDWNRLGPAKRALFSGTEVINRYGKNLDKIARQAERMKFSQKEAANPSGSGQFAANVGTALAGGGAAVTGNVPVMAMVLGTVAANNGAARVMTSPRFVNWLARGMELPPEAQPAHMAKLATITKGMTLDQATAVNGLMEDLAMIEDPEPRASESWGLTITGDQPKNAR